jgi:hypothetical protein
VNKILQEPIIEDELIGVAKAMAKGKSLEYDRVVEFYVKFCHGIGREYTKMIDDHVVSKGRFSKV